ncbi:MAG TPA: ABC transporter ATP-binding protein [Dehalococcoidia bacterium]|nr:ABC transporter ATP-binding protein [Dehalococcoidia bacterium]
MPEPPREVVLSVENIQTFYGDSHVLQGVSLEVSAGQLVCLFGRNGAGKTTTIRSIIGFNRPRDGRVVFAGTNVAGMAPERIARLGIGLVPQGRRIFSDLTVRENLLFGARPHNGPWDLARAYKTFPRLEERRNNRGDQLSGGEQQMLSIARALLLNPRLLLMDEPSDGLAPLIVREIGRIIADIRSEGLSVLLVEQNLALGLSVADHCYVLSKGTTVYEGSPDDLRQDDEVKHRYLGV